MTLGAGFVPFVLAVNYSTYKRIKALTQVCFYEMDKESTRFVFEISIDSRLQERVPIDLSDINVGTPIAITSKLTTGDEVMYAIEMNPFPVTAGDAAKAPYSRLNG